MKTEHQHTDETTPESSTQTESQHKMTRRQALALVGKHAVYTAPAILAVLSVTKSKDAHAVPCVPGTPGCSS